MILALITPHAFPSVRGNAVTVRRIESGLRDRGVEVHVFGLDRCDPETILARLERVRPDVVHGFHATASGPLVLTASRLLRIPAAITMTGTDVNQDLVDPERRPQVLEVVGSVQAVAVFHDSIREMVCREAPVIAPRIRVVAQSVRCGDARYRLREALGLHPAECVFFQPAGVRRVKNIPAVIPMLVALQRRRPALRYVLTGPVIEPDEAARVATLLRGLTWATQLGALSHDQVCGSLAEVDAVLNSSVSEGGMSNAVLEAMSRGVPVLASDIAGNRSIIVDEEDGFLFGSEQEFLHKAERLMDDPALRAALGRRARTKIETQYRPEGEIDKYLALYTDLAAGGKG